MKRRPVPLLRIGMFVLMGFILLVVFIFVIGSKEKLFSSTTEFEARFPTVSGLKKGAQIQLDGINVGSVSEIRLPRNSRDSVTVRMKVISDALHLVHTDSRALISTEGLIGEKIIVISVGGDTTLPITAGATIQGVGTKDYSLIYDTLNAAVSRVRDVADQAYITLKTVREGNGTLARLLNDDKLYRSATELTEQSRTTMANANVAIAKASESFNVVTHNLTDVVERINRGEGSLGKLLTKDEVYTNVRQSSENLQNASYQLQDALAKISLGGGRFAEVMEGLKHNFLIKSYFEDRGYWDAPEFEMTIDRKIDSLRRLQERLDSRTNSQKQ
jgi:phospholipid/cholesterol/gamma-HCH transport system substrate-binding protein